MLKELIHPDIWDPSVDPKSIPIENIDMKCVFPDLYTCIFTVFIKHNTPPEMLKFEPMILTMFKKTFKSVKTLIENQT